MAKHKILVKGRLTTKSKKQSLPDGHHWQMTFDDVAAYILYVGSDANTEDCTEDC